MRITGFENDPHSEQGSACPRNRFGITDYERLSRIERAFTAQRIHELERKGITGDFNAAHLRKLHWYIFRDVFPWAGDFRVVGISKPGGASFADPQFIQATLTGTFEKLKGENLLAGLDDTSFVERMAFYLGEVNAVHPFREGNGRTQREFFRQLGLYCGFLLSWDGISKEENILASVLSHTQLDNSGLVQVIKAAIAGKVPEGGA